MKCGLLLLAGLVALAHSATVIPTVEQTTSACMDKPSAGCWNRPDESCFGIYEPWSRDHCPVRCGFCKGPYEPCVDKLDYCDRFENTTCTLPSYFIWARENCRKHCNLCDYVPTRPQGTGTTQAGGMGGTTSGIGNTSGSGTGSIVPPSNAPNEIPGTVAVGTQKSIIIQGPGLPNRTDVCYYHGQEYKQNDRWNDGCVYECACMDPTSNRVVCSEKCTRWELKAQMADCKLVKEEGECCDRLECQQPSVTTTP